MLPAFVECCIRICIERCSLRQACRSSSMTSSCLAPKPVLLLVNAFCSCIAGGGACTLVAKRPCERAAGSNPRVVQAWLHGLLACRDVLLGRIFRTSSRALEDGLRGLFGLHRRPGHASLAQLIASSASARVLGHVVWGALQTAETTWRARRFLRRFGRRRRFAIRATPALRPPIWA